MNLLDAFVCLSYFIDSQFGFRLTDDMLRLPSHTLFIHKVVHGACLRSTNPNRKSTRLGSQMSPTLLRLHSTPLQPKLHAVSPGSGTRRIRFILAKLIASLALCVGSIWHRRHDLDAIHAIRYQAT